LRPLKQDPGRQIGLPVLVGLLGLVQANPCLFVVALILIGRQLIKLGEMSHPFANEEAKSLARWIYCVSFRQN
jgi:hypothetical protein